MGGNFISLKPRLEAAKLAQRRATGTSTGDMQKINRRFMQPQSTSDRAQSANRVEKLTVATKKRRSLNESVLSNRFEGKQPELLDWRFSHLCFIDAIHAYRIELASETERILGKTEKDLEKQLADVTVEFSGKLQIVAEYEDNIFKPISEERLEITSSLPGKNGLTRKEHGSLADRMRDFETIVSIEAAHLGELWKEWQETQLELVCLAIEVLGPEGVELLFNQDDNRLAAKVRMAFESSKEHESTWADVKDKASHIERSVRTIADETTNNLNEQEKVRRFRERSMNHAANTLLTAQGWKINEKKKIQKIKQIMMEAD
jgi:hypothetical protein